MWTSSFWKATAERAIKTFAQTLVASGIVVGVAGWDKWQAALIAAGIAALLSVVTSVASISIGDKGSPSLVGDELTPNVAAVIPEGDLEPPPLTGGKYNNLEAATDPANIAKPQ